MLRCIVRCKCRKESFMESNQRQLMGSVGVETTHIVPTHSAQLNESTATLQADIQAQKHRKTGHSGTQFVARGQSRTDVISVLLVDDHALMREGLQQLLALERDFKVAGEA